MIAYPVPDFLKTVGGGIYAYGTHKQDNSLHGDNKDKVHAGFGSVAVTQPYYGGCAPEYR